MSSALREGAPPAKPPWIRVRPRALPSPGYERTRELVRRLRLHTVCEEAACPNVAECWSEGHATAMILGDVCTRACAFCNVRTGLPVAGDPGEPERLARAVAELGLRHVVVTSVDRDDLPDGGAGHFVRSIEAIRRAAPGTTVEVLTPDFRRKPGAAEAVAAARPDVYNHNVETVPRLYRRVRPGAHFRESLALLARVKQVAPGVVTKSGLMPGLGEARSEVLALLDELGAADGDVVTIGHSRRPSPAHAPVAGWWTPEEFDELGREAQARGFLMVASSPMTRSSYHAERDFERLRERRSAAAGAV